MKKNYIKVIIISICLLIPILCFCLFKKTNYRDGVIIEVPSSSFNSKGELIDKNWKEYLSKNKPIGIIFFADHLFDKQKSKNTIDEIKKIIGEDVILSADEEGGRINRIDWIDIMSAEDISLKYQQIKNEKGIDNAVKFVKEQYKQMFKEMKEIGLNTTFAPNLDLNKYYLLDKNSKEYQNYQNCVKYTKLYRTPENKIKQEDRENKRIANMFFAYLDEYGIRKLNVLGYDMNIINKIRNEWKNLQTNKKKKLIDEFNQMAKYANYVSVVGDRSYSGDPKIVAEIAEIFVDTAKEYGINCVMKHALGHGRVDADTHIDKQHSNVSLEEILHDIYPYKKLSNKVNFVMPSHIIYDVIDDKQSAINSQNVLNFMRKEIKQDIIFITDDISMEGADNKQHSPCDLWIISHKPLTEIKKISIFNRLDKDKVDRIFSKFVK